MTGRQVTKSAVARLHLITDDAVVGAPGFEAAARAVVESAGDVALHLRARRVSARVLHRLGATLAAVCSAAGASLVVNERVDVARAVGAAGVQLGAGALSVADARAVLAPGQRIGRSVHTAAEAEAAARAGADWLVVGTIWESASHPGRPGGGIELLRACVAAADGTPVLAIGGVTAARVAEVAASGAYGVAVLSPVWHAADPAAAVIELMAAVKEEWT